MSAYDQTKALAQELEESFYATLALVDRYVVLMETLSDEEQAKTAPNAELIRRFHHQKQEGQAMASVIDGQALEALLRIIDRILMIKHAEEGTFL